MHSFACQWFLINGLRERTFSWCSRDKSCSHPRGTTCLTTQAAGNSTWPRGTQFTVEEPQSGDICMRGHWDRYHSVGFAAGLSSPSMFTEAKWRGGFPFWVILPHTKLLKRMTFEQWVYLTGNSFLPSIDWLIIYQTINWLENRKMVSKQREQGGQNHP